MKQCVVKVQSQHHLDVIIGRVRSLGGKHKHYKFISVPSETVYTVYQSWIDMELPTYVWLECTQGLTSHLHNHTCNCKVFHTVQDAIDYLGLHTIKD